MIDSSENQKEITDSENTMGNTESGVQKNKVKTDSKSEIKPYRVLARQYRPQRFEDLLGQEAMVKTLENAFKTGRIAHAFMLTGVRGVGKTTTARLLARALNYKTTEKDTPDLKLDPLGEHCQAIMESCHIDVFEMDAASRTGVNDIREILDGLRYAPVSARYKIYIIDEVHMLSVSAFNALLKTLEEPPEHVKFIFATTEVRKIPVTVLSRCQRFDLKRIETHILSDYLGKISQKEGVQIEKTGLSLIGRSAEGSVRDGLSLLDQAIVQTYQDKTISASMVEGMLGLAGEIHAANLFEEAVLGKAQKTSEMLEGFYQEGINPNLLIKDILSLCHYTTRLKIIESPSETEYSQEVHEVLHRISRQLTLAQLTHIWQILIKTHQEIRFAPNAMQALEMAVLRIGIAMSLPPPEKAQALLKKIETSQTENMVLGQESSSSNRPVSASPKAERAEIPESVSQKEEYPFGQKNTFRKEMRDQDREIISQDLKQENIQNEKKSTENPVKAFENPELNIKEETDCLKKEQFHPDQGTLEQTALHTALGVLPQELREKAQENISSVSGYQHFKNFIEVVEYAGACREICLKSDLERFVHLITFSQGKLSFSVGEGAPAQLAQKISKQLQEWTGHPWLVTVEPQGEGDITLYQKKKEQEKKQYEVVKNHPLVREAFQRFKECKILSITKTKELSAQKSGLLESHRQDMLIENRRNSDGFK